MADTQNPVHVDNTTIHGDGTEEHPLVAAGASGTPGGGPNDIQFNDGAGGFGGDDDLQFFPASSPGGEQFVVNIPVGANPGAFLLVGNQAPASAEVQMLADGGFVEIDLSGQDAGAGGILLSTEDTSNPSGITLEDSGGGGIILNDLNSGSIQIQSNIAIGLVLTAAGQIKFQGNGSAAADILIGGAIDKIGFYGATPVVQAAAPTTLPEVITILTNLGLCA